MARENRYKGLHLAQLRSFCQAAAQGSFTAAGQTLGLSKATVWQQVRAIERKLGTVLLRRDGKAVELTADGRLLLEMIQPHVDGIDSLESWFAARRKEQPQRLTVASIPYLLMFHLPAVVHSFTRAYPTAHLNLLAETWQDVISLVDQGKADFGIAPVARDLAPAGNLEYEPLFDLSFHLITSRKHPLAHKKRITLADVVQYPLIQPSETSFSRVALDQLLRKHRLAEQARWVLVSRSVDMTHKYVALGVGIALEYLSPSVGPTLRDIRVRAFDSEVDTIPVVLIVRRFAHLTQAALAFRDDVRKHVSK